jgi:hypothetical protein
VGSVERGTDTYPLTVHELTGKERDRIYDEQARRYPGFADYARQTAGVRTIPVLALRRSWHVARGSHRQLLNLDPLDRRLARARLTIGNTTTGRAPCISVASPPPGPFGWQAFFGVAPFAPHLAEELWSRMGGDYSVHEQGWPAHDPSAMRADRVTVAIQVDGKTRDRMEVRLEPRDDALERAALASERIQRHLSQGSVADVIYVQDRLINLVTR